MTKMTKKEQLKQNLAWLGMAGGGHITKFKKIYSSKNLDLSINDIIDNMQARQVKWALVQVQNSINKLQKS